MRFWQALEDAVTISEELNAITRRAEVAGALNTYRDRRLTRSAAVQGRAALGGRAGERDARPGRGSRDEPYVKAPLCAEVDGFFSRRTFDLARGVKSFFCTFISFFVVLVLLLQVVTNCSTGS